MRSNQIIVILFLVIFANSTTFAQSTTSSPYSKYGVGVLRSEAFAQNFGMGGVGIGLRSFRDINRMNPASYSGIVSTTFDLGVTNNALTLDDGTETQSQSNSYIDHIAFGFPMVKNVWGMSFGISPYSNVGYEYDEVVADPVAGNISIYNEGSGAINKFYFGNALAIKIDSSSLISFGANGYFLFGSMEYDEKVIYGDLPNSFNLWNLREMSVADFGVDFGVQYHKTFMNSKDQKMKLTLGATYGLATDLNAKRTEIIRSFSGNADFGTIKDTISFEDEVDEIVQLPAEIGFGVSLEKEGKWTVAADYKTTNWGALATNESLVTYKSNYSIAAGVEFIPKYDGNNYFERMSYRLGTRFSDSHIEIDNIGWNEYGITFGIGLPIRRSENSYPRLNFGMEYGNRGTTDSGLIKEKFVNFNVGITINATWFKQRKYD